jgi:hypothetical protein
LRNTAGDLESFGESSEYAADSITKLQAEILQNTGGKVNIMVDPTTFKGTYDILVELSKVWKDLTDVQQASLTRLIAGNDKALSSPCAYRNMRRLCVYA